MALNPATPLDAVAHVLDLMDLLPVMTVNPGFGGQRYIAAMEPKIAAARRLVDTAPHPVGLEVDGEIGPETAATASAAGADVLCAGGALFSHPEGQAEAVAELRAAAPGQYVTAQTSTAPPGPACTSVTCRPSTPNNADAVP